ncbi:MAG: ATP-binding cassette domain-containing protein [Bacteroidia bacterium]|nr:ATP-binding cassette domain-containing protein [Bacteroidia bacterium]
MRESILNALMQLFAIFSMAKKDQPVAASKAIIESYLKHYLASEIANEYLKIFDLFLVQYHQEIKDKNGETGLIIDRIKNICQHINKELSQKERTIILLRILEFINADKTEKEELELVSIAAEYLNIVKQEFENIKAFIFDPLGHLLVDPQGQLTKGSAVNRGSDSDYGDLAGQTDFLVISKKYPSAKADYKHLFKEHLNGEIVVLHIKTINTFIFRYLGNDTLYIESNNIIPCKFYILDNGSIIKGLRITPVYYNDIVNKFSASVSKTGLVFTGEEIEFRFKNSENGLHKFTFSEESGQLIGIMGGSGAGKTTLLNILSGKLQPHSGKILINGCDVRQVQEKIKGIIGFVPQDDLLFEELTVYQNLFYNAKLCFSNFTGEQLKENVNRVLSDLGLSEIKNLKVGSPLNKFISGGQRKRLNIALELIREPAILFADEPTSGLSSMDSEKVMLLLKEQARSGKLVIVNIHQPSSEIFKLFDKLWILDKGGFPVYTGNPVDAIVYFKRISEHINASESECRTCGNVEPEQILQIIESKMIDEYGKVTDTRKITPKQWHYLFLEEIEMKFEKKEYIKELPAGSFKIPNKFRQFIIFSIRNFLSKITNRQYLLINLLEAPVLAFILGYFTKYTTDEGYIFSQNKNLPAYIFMCIVVALFMGLAVSAEEIIKDKKILQRESFLNLSRFAYLNSKILFLFILSAVQTLSFVIIGNNILEIKGMTAGYWLVLFSASCAANMLGLNISAGLNSVITAYISIPFLLVPQLLLGGVIVKFDDLHKSLASEKYVSFIGDIMISRWAYEALAVEQFKNNKYQKNFFDLEREKSCYSFFSSLLIPGLLTKVDENIVYSYQNKNPEEKDRNFNILKNEISRLQEIAPVNDFNNIEKLLSKKVFNDETADSIKEYLNSLASYFARKSREAGSKADEKINQLIAQLGKDGVNQLKQDYYNTGLADMVLNRTELKKILETGDRLISKNNPVYTYPELNFGRAHFYAPVKFLFGKQFDTFNFNLGVIWLMSIVLYFMLVYDVLRKIIDFRRPARLP